MGTLDRREYMKTMVGGATILAMGTPAFAAIPQASSDEKKSAGPSSRAGFWQRVDSAKARNLVESAIKAARAEVRAQRAVNSSQRAAILLGSGADTQYHKEAVTHYEVRTTELRKSKDALSRFVKTAGDSGERHFSTFLQKGGMKEFTAGARKHVIESLLHSDISPDEARSAVKALDDRLEKIGSLKSFADATSYLDHHLDELIERKMPAEDPNGLCVLILLISSVLVVLALIAAIICIFTLGLGCQNILNQMIAQACP